MRKMPLRTKYLDAKSSKHTKANNNNSTENKPKPHSDPRVTQTTTHLRATDEQGTGTDRGDAATACWNSIPYRPARAPGPRSRGDPRGGDGPRSCPPPLPRGSGAARARGGLQSAGRLSADAGHVRSWRELERAEPRSAPARVLRATANPALLRLVSEERRVAAECLSDGIAARGEARAMVRAEALLREAKAEGEERWRRRVGSADVSGAAEMAGEEGGQQCRMSQKEEGA